MGYLVYALVVGLGFGGYAWWQRKKKQDLEAKRAELEKIKPRDRLDLIIDPTAEQDRLNPRPRSPEQASEDCWVPPGESISLNGYTIARGMIYVGAGLYKDRRAWKPEDFLVDPTREVSRDVIDHEGRTVSLWPSYSKLYADARAGYLAWLADGAQRPDTPEGFVMLYVYGLQYRLLKDQPSPEEQTQLWAELDRLEAAYGTYPFFAQTLANLREAYAAQSRSSEEG